MKSKYLIILTIVAALLLGTSYLFMQASDAQQPKDIPSVSAKAPGTPQVFATKPGLPGPQKPSVKLTTSLGAYGLSTAAVQPEKTGVPQPPGHPSKGPVGREGGETCATATVIGGLPYSDAGYTCDNVNDYDEICPYGGSTAPDVVYSYTPAVNEVVDITLCNGSGYDTKLYVYQGSCPGVLVACNDDACPGYVSELLNVSLTGGNTYYIIVDGYGGDCGNYIIDITSYQPCDVVCPGGGIPEGEPVCYDEYVDNYNGGCNTPPNYPFQNINCNTTICGTSGTYLFTGLNYRDTDWFKLVITQQTTLTFKCVAEFPLLIFLIDAGTENCSDFSILTSATANACDTATITWSLEPGVYWLWVGPSVFSGVTCGSEYVAIVNCEVATTGACCDDFDPYTCTIETPANCAAMPNHTFQGLGTDCGPPNPCLPGASNDECTGAIPVSAPDCPTVVTVSGTTVGATIDCPDVLGWNAVWYSFELPYASNKLTIDYCPTATPIYQIGIVLYPSPCLDCYAYIISTYQWVSCPNGNTGPQMWWSGLPAGTYYLPVAVWDYNMNPFMDFAFDACVEEGAPPGAGDNCASAIVVPSLPYTTTGNSCGYVNDYDETCPYSGSAAPDVVYSYSPAADQAIIIDLCNSFYDTKVFVYEDVCPTSPFYACNDDACGSDGYRSAIYGLSVYAGHTYYIVVDGYGSGCGDYDLRITEAGPAPPNDQCTGAPIINTFPQTVYGTTIGATVDCPGVLDWNAVWYQFDVPYTCNNITVDYCPTDWSIGTIGIVLYNSCPPDCYAYIVTSGYQFVSCPNGTTNPQMWWYNLPGPASYWLPVYPFALADFGFTVSVEECVPCDVVCPTEGIPEGEPDCYDDYVDNYNGGCNTPPDYPFQNINCNTTICGKSGTYLYTGLQYRDTDWFRVEVGDGDLTFKAVAEFPLQTILLGAGSENCSDYTFLDYRQVNMCDTATISMWVPSGVYWLWVGPSVFAGYPCGLEYVMQVQCTGFGPQIAVSPTSFDQLLNPTGACATATESLFISSVGGEDLNWSIAENPPAAWLSVSPTAGTLPPGQTATLNVSFNAGGMGPGDYNTSLDITSNAPKGVVSVPVHLKVERAPEIDVVPRLWVPVIPGCSMDKALRVDNLGTGELRFEVEVKGTPPPLDNGGILNMVPNRKMEDFFKTQTNLGDKSNLPALTASAPAEASKVNTPASGPKRVAGSKQGVIWDNGGDAGYAYSSQLDEVYPFDSQVADDFILTDAMNVTDVHWWGAFWNGPPDEVDPSDFYIYIYADDGTGNAPTGAGMEHPQGTALATYFFPQLTGYPLSPNGNHEYNVTLSPPFQATGGVKYWIAIQAVFPYPPQWGWVNTDIIQLNTAVQGFPLLGYPFWTMDNGVDMAFYLTGEESMVCPFTVSPEEGTIPAESFFDVFLTFDGTVFENCVEETLTCYLVFTSNDCDESQVTVPVYMWSARGDVNGDCKLDVLDVVFLLNYIFVGGPAPDPLCMGDVNRSGGLPDSDDAMYLISYMFLYGPPPTF